MINTIHNIITGEITEVEMTTEEIAKIKVLDEAFKKEQKDSADAKAAKAHEKSALLAKLGITEDEAKLLLS